MSYPLRTKAQEDERQKMLASLREDARQNQIKLGIQTEAQQMQIARNLMDEDKKKIALSLRISASKPDTREAAARESRKANEAALEIRQEILRMEEQRRKETSTLLENMRIEEEKAKLDAAYSSSSLISHKPVEENAPIAEVPQYIWEEGQSLYGEDRLQDYILGGTANSLNLENSKEAIPEALQEEVHELQPEPIMASLQEEVHQPQPEPIMGQARIMPSFKGAKRPKSTKLTWPKTSGFPQHEADEKTRTAEFRAWDAMQRRVSRLLKGKSVTRESREDAIRQDQKLANYAQAHLFHEEVRRSLFPLDYEMKKKQTAEKRERSSAAYSVNLRIAAEESLLHKKLTESDETKTLPKEAHSQTANQKLRRDIQKKEKPLQSIADKSAEAKSKESHLELGLKAELDLLWEEEGKRKKIEEDTKRQKEADDLEREVWEEMEESDLELSYNSEGFPDDEVGFELSLTPAEPKPQSFEEVEKTLTFDDPTTLTDEEDVWSIGEESEDEDQSAKNIEGRRQAEAIKFRNESEVANQEALRDEALKLAGNFARSEAKRKHAENESAREKKRLRRVSRKAEGYDSYWADFTPDKEVTEWGQPTKANPHPVHLKRPATEYEIGLQRKLFERHHPREIARRDADIQKDLADVSAARAEREMAEEYQRPIFRMPSSSELPSSSERGELSSASTEYGEVPRSYTSTINATPQSIDSMYISSFDLSAVAGRHVPVSIDQSYLLEIDKIMKAAKAQRDASVFTRFLAGGKERELAEAETSAGEEGEEYL